MIDDLTAALRDAIAAVAIGERGSFSWFGVRSSVPRVQGASRKHLDEWMRVGLQNQLYRSFYSIGFAAPTAGVDERERGSEVSLVEPLSRANCGSGVLDRGWTMIERRDSVAIVRKNGITIEVGADRIAGRRSRGTVTLRYLNELRRASPGFYTALGDRALQPDEALVRVYWNIRARAAVKFMRLTTRLLNEASIPFHAKIAADARHFDRCDAAVLYVAKRGWPRVSPLIATLHQCLQSDLKPLTPVFTKPIARGVGLAEDPPGQESFGLHRCGIVADALLSAHRKRKHGVVARLDEVIAAFGRCGISFLQPYLNPRSADIYPLLRI